MMDNASLIGLSRQMTLRRQMDIVANNLANLGTSGFRAENVVLEGHRMPKAEMSTSRFADRHLHYVVDRMTSHDFAAGPFKPTGNPLDVAIDGDAWLVVETPEGERYTRNGSLSLNAQGELVTADGHPVLGEAGPVVFDDDDGTISIAGDGSISTDQGDNDRLRLVAFETNRVLKPEGASLFRNDGDIAALPAENVRVAQGMVEGSNVNAIAEMSRMIEITRTYTTLARLMERTDEQRRDAIGTLGRVE